jgi:hypothetical protein
MDGKFPMRFLVDAQDPDAVALKLYLRNRGVHYDELLRVLAQARAGQDESQNQMGLDPRYVQGAELTKAGVAGLL